jgi:hypothetical protein
MMTTSSSRCNHRDTEAQRKRHFDVAFLCASVSLWLHLAYIGARGAADLGDFPPVEITESLAFPHFFHNLHDAIRFESELLLEFF